MVAQPSSPSKSPPKWQQHQQQPASGNSNNPVHDQSVDCVCPLRHSIWALDCLFGPFSQGQTFFFGTKDPPPPPHPRSGICVPPSPCLYFYYIPDFVSLCALWDRQWQDIRKHGDILDKEFNLSDGVIDRARFIVYLGFGFGTMMSKHVQRLPSCANSGLMN
jgi:hypothetical protein